MSGYYKSLYTVCNITDFDVSMRICTYVCVGVCVFEVECQLECVSELVCARDAAAPGPQEQC